MAWEEIVKTVAPAVAGFFGTPLAGVATKALVDGLFEDGKGDESKLENLIKNATPETLAKIKEIEAKFKTDMANANIKLEEIAHEDRKDARKIFSINQWPQIVLTGIFVLGFFFLLGLIIIYMSQLMDMPGWLQGTFNTIIGVLTGSVGTILTFWFGSSKGSQDKDKLKV
jgi:hypothetical protein